MSDEAPATPEATPERKRAPASNFLAIVRGRLPLLLVHAVRFHPVISAMGNKDIAAKFGTSVGKVFDIKKGRNFAYITESYKPTAEDVAASKAWGTQFGAANSKGLTAQGDKALIDQITMEYEAGGLATAEDIAKVSEARVANRKPREPKGEKQTITKADVGQVSAEELLS